MKTKFFHKRVKINGILQSHGGTTTAFVVDDDNNVVASAMAKCHTNDNFNKEQGRVKANGRLNSARYCTKYNPPITQAQFLTELATD